MIVHYEQRLTRPWLSTTNTSRLRRLPGRLLSQRRRPRRRLKLRYLFGLNIPLASSCSRYWFYSILYLRLIDLHGLRKSLWCGGSCPVGVGAAICISLPYHHFTTCTTSPPLEVGGSLASADTSSQGQLRDSQPRMPICIDRLFAFRWRLVIGVLQSQ